MFSFRKALKHFTDNARHRGNIISITIINKENLYCKKSTLNKIVPIPEYYVHFQQI